MKTLAHAIGYAHEKGIVHRDLKPTNVLLCGDEASPLGQCMPKIADFGLAKQIGPALATFGPTTEAGVILGTAEYMAPEQASGRPATGPTADVYALGVILYEMLTGRVPFKGTNRLETVSQVIHDEPLSPRRLQPRLPRDMETICLKCLEKEPHRRYQSAADLTADLQRFLNKKPIKARPVSLPERIWRWGSREPRRAGTLVALFFGLALGIGMLVASERRANKGERLALERQQLAEAAQLDAENSRTETLRLLSKVANLVVTTSSKNPDQGFA